MVKRHLSRIYMTLIFLFLYLPLLMLMVLSFNRSKSRVTWGGLTLDWYRKCFENERIMSAFSTTLQVTLLAAVIATIIGTLAALGIFSMKKRNQTLYLGATNIPLLNADIVTGLSMMLLFVRFMNLGFVTVLLAHITFNIPYVILNVLPKLRQTSRATYEAALDLGASPLLAFYKVTWPQISPGVFSGFLMAVTMSLDDFSITYFTKGAGINTLSTMLYTELRKGVSPELYALSTVLFFTVLLLLTAANLHPEPVNPDSPRRLRRKSHIKRAVSLAVIALLTGGSLFVLAGSTSAAPAGKDRVLTVLNYGKYLDPRVLKEFEQKTGIQVRYEEYESPEEMYTKYKAGSIDYDLICTSDYMIEKLDKEGELLPIDYGTLAHYDNIDPRIIRMSEAFDPRHDISLPYFYGTLGILYNKKEVRPEDVESWSCLWDHRFKGDMIMTNSVRDAFAPALITRGYSINDTDPGHLQSAMELLAAQSADVSAYYVDETCDEMAAGNAKIAVCYSGEAAEAMEVNSDLDYIVPAEGSNLWIDSWIIPKTCSQRKNALLFLDYLCEEDVAMTNFSYVFYASPILSVIRDQKPAYRTIEAVTPSSSTIDRCQVYRALDDDSAALINRLWQQLKTE